MLFYSGNINLDYIAYLWSAILDNIVIQVILFLINILGYDKYMKGYYKYMKGYDKYINDCYKYIKDYLEKIFTAMTNILTPI